MLRLTVSTEEYIQLGDNIKIAFLGGSKNHLKIMIDAPKEVKIARGKTIAREATTPEERSKLPKYYAAPDTKEGKAALNKWLEIKKEAETEGKL